MTNNTITKKIADSIEEKAALHAARVIFGMSDLKVTRLDEDNWTEIHQLLTWTYTEGGPTEPVPENIIIPFAGNYFIPVNKGDYLVSIRGGGYKLVDKKAFIGRITPNMLGKL